MSTYSENCSHEPPLCALLISAGVHLQFSPMASSVPLLRILISPQPSQRSAGCLFTSVAVSFRACSTFSCRA
ncbi:hypothetical protein EMPG_15153 [Blastomyces silverae]|uniref:Uncharacterized protein n=1 Tax=Blastomyces silverae TaxID=2060906 RepID=A0A0H1BE76_9EURO|nr:hypothetical protein EMPG_15153 [Blastomyces silverae]